MKKLVLLTGKPGTGKSTLFAKLVSTYARNDLVFYVLSKEVREKGQRIGFEVVTSECMEPRIFAKRGEDGKYELKPDVWFDVAGQLRKNADQIILLGMQGASPLSQSNVLK